MLAIYVLAGVFKRQFTILLQTIEKICWPEEKCFGGHMTWMQFLIYTFESLNILNLIIFNQSRVVCWSIELFSSLSTITMTRCIIAILINQPRIVLCCFSSELVC